MLSKRKENGKTDNKIKLVQALLHKMIFKWKTEVNIDFELFFNF